MVKMRMMGHYNPNPKAYIAFSICGHPFRILKKVPPGLFRWRRKENTYACMVPHRLKNVYTDPTFFSKQIVKRSFLPPTGFLNRNRPSLPTKLRTTLLYIAPPHSLSPPLSLSLSLIVWSSHLH